MVLRLLLLCVLVFSSCAAVREKPDSYRADASAAAGNLEPHSHHKERLDRI